MRAAWTFGLGLVAALAGPAAADGRLLADDAFATRGGGAWLLDGGVATGLAPALPAGLATGLGVAVTRACGCRWFDGARASWVAASASGEAWTVRHDALALRATGGLRHQAGRGTVALRLGVGATFVREHRLRNQGARAGLEGDALETSALATLPAAELEGVVAVHVAGPWLLVVSGGPSVSWLAGRARGGFDAALGVGWQP